MRTMTKTLRTTLQIIAVILVVGTFMAIIFTQNAQAEELSATRARINDNCAKSLDDLVTLTKALNNALSKVQVVNSQNQYTLLLSEIWRTSGEAVNALGNLPANFAHVREANAFLVQTGDYARSLLEKAARGALPTEQDKAQITQLYQGAAGLYEKLYAASMQGVDFAGLMENGDYYGAETSWLELGNAPANPGENSTDGGESTDGQGGTKNTEKQNETVPEKLYPSLIYDGPFSDSTEKAQPKGLGTGQVDEATAAEHARQFLNGILAGELRSEGLAEGKIPSYHFVGQTIDGQNVEIEITAAGGKCLNMRVTAQESAPGNQATVPEDLSETNSPKPDQETGKRLAEVGKEFLKTRGFESMESTYAQYYGGMAVINYAFVQDGTLIYPDLIKVWVEVDTDGIVGFEANNFWFSHVERSIPKPGISEQDAKAKLSPELTVQSTRVALIPKGKLEERLCFEFKCTFMEESYIVYINAETGMEEEVYKIIDSDKGQLVV